MYHFEFTQAAAENVEETGINPADDVESLLAGQHTRDSLLAHCLDGAHRDRVQGWTDYVDAVVRCAEKRRSLLWYCERMGRNQHEPK